MIKLIRKLMAIAANYDGDFRRLRSRIDDLDALVRDRTNIAVDVGFRGANHVIVVGRYRNTDYVQTYTLDGLDIGEMIEHLRRLEKNAVVRRVDAPPVFRASFERARGMSR